MNDKELELQNNTNNEDIKSLIDRVSHAARDLVRHHVELAKLEAKEKVTRLSKDGAMLAVGVVCGLFALILLSVALAAALGSTLGSLALGFFLVGVVWLLFTVILAGLGLAKLRKDEGRPALSATGAQLKMDKRVLAEV